MPRKSRKDISLLAACFSIPSLTRYFMVQSGTMEHSSSIANLQHHDKRQHVDRKSIDLTDAEVTKYTLREVGTTRSLEHRIFFHQEGALG